MQNVLRSFTVLRGALFQGYIHQVNTLPNHISFWIIDNQITTVAGYMESDT